MSGSQSSKVLKREVKERILESTESVKGELTRKSNLPNPDNLNLDARYQNQWPHQAGDKQKYVFETYAFDFYASIILGVRIKTEFLQHHFSFFPMVGNIGSRGLAGMFLNQYTI